MGRALPYLSSSHSWTRPRAYFSVSYPSLLPGHSPEALVCSEVAHRACLPLSSVSTFPVVRILVPPLTSPFKHFLGTRDEVENAKEHISQCLLSSLSKEGNWRPTGDVGIIDGRSAPSTCQFLPKTIQRMPGSRDHECKKGNQEKENTVLVSKRQ